MTTPFLEEAVLKDYLRSEIVTDATTRTAAILAATEWLNRQCSRQFVVASVTPSARLFDAPYASRLDINDCTTVTAVVDNVSTLTVDVGYKLYPLNGLSVTGEQVPYNVIERLSSGYYYQWYSYGRPSTVSVTATWGWLAIPSMIVEACKIVAKDYVQNRDVSHGLVDISTVGGVGSRENRLVKDAIEAYASPASIGIG